MELKMPPILNNLSYLVMALVGPMLFTAWMLTGFAPDGSWTGSPKHGHGFYNLYATYIVCCTTYVAVGLGILGLNEAQNKTWRFERSRELFRNKSLITHFSYFLSVVIFLTLAWYGKFVIAAFVGAHVVLTVFMRYLFLGSPAHKQDNKPIEEPTLGTTAEDGN